MLYITSLYLIHFLPSCLYLLTPYPYLAPLLTLFPTGNH